MGRQAQNNGCTFRATQPHVVERPFEEHWGTITLSERHVAEIRRLVLDLLERVLPEQRERRDSTQATIERLDREANKLFNAHSPTRSTSGSSSPSRAGSQPSGATPSAKESLIIGLFDALDAAVGLAWCSGAVRERLAVGSWP